MLRFYGTQRFITAFTNARHLSLSWLAENPLASQERLRSMEPVSKYNVLRYIQYSHV